MAIGDIINDRMTCLGITAESLADECFIDEDYLIDIMNNKIPISKIDSFDIDMLSSALYCNPEYFYDSDERKKDVVFSSFNRGNDTCKSNMAKAHIQEYMRSYVFLKEIIEKDKNRL